MWTKMPKVEAPPPDQAVKCHKCGFGRNAVKCQKDRTAVPVRNHTPTLWQLCTCETRYVSVCTAVGSDFCVLERDGRPPDGCPFVQPLDASINLLQPRMVMQLDLITLAVSGICASWGHRAHSGSSWQACQLSAMGSPFAGVPP